MLGLSLTLFEIFLSNCIRMTLTFSVTWSHNWACIFSGFRGNRPQAYNWCHNLNLSVSIFFYRAMHFSAKRGLAIACRLSVRPSVTLVDCDHIGWNSSRIISPLVSLGCSLFVTQTSRVYSKESTPKFGSKVTHPCWFERRRHSIANCGRMVTDSTMVTMESL